MTTARLVGEEGGDQSRVARVLARLGELGDCFAATDPDTWRARCPCHLEAGYFLRVSLAADGRAALRCDQGCTVADIAAAAAIDPTELVPALDPSAPRSIFRLLSDVELEQLPPITFLVDGVLPAAGLGVIYGPPAAGKSFLMLDMACCIATGAHWLGKPTRQGRVVYVAAEGSAGLSQRMSAWKHHQGVTASLPIHFITQPANLLTPPHLVQLLLAFETLPTPPALVIIDTLARSMPGGDENAAKDLGIVVDRADQLKRETGASVMLVHHPAKGSDIERGSGALRGGVDAMLFVKVDDDRRELRCEKAKDWAPFDPIPFSLLPVDDSCVVVAGEKAESNGGVTLNRENRVALKSLSDVALPDGATVTQWRTASGMAEGSFYRARKYLVTEGYVAERGQKRGKTYGLTPSGQHALALNSQTTLNSLSTVPTSLTLTLSHPRRGDSDESKARAGTGKCMFCPRLLPGGVKSCPDGAHLKPGSGT